MACHHERHEQVPHRGRGTAWRFIIEQWCWPDGRGWTEQEVLVSDMFELMRGEVTKVRSRV